MFLRAINTLKVLSILAFFLMLLWIYAYLPEKVNFYSPGDPHRFIEMTKGTFFYINLFSFAVVNFFLYWFAFFIKSRAGIPNVFRALKTDNKLILLTAWLGGFHFSINILLSGVLFYAGLRNINGHATPEQYNIFLLTGSVLTFISLSGMLVLVLRHTLTGK